MSTTTENKTVNTSEINMTLVSTLLRNTETETAYDAVMWRSELTKMEADIQRLKDECDEYLNEVFGEQKRITTQDNKYTVIRVASNRAQYPDTFFIRLATRFLKWAQAISPKEVKPVGRGYYYKAGK